MALRSLSTSLHTEGTSMETFYLPNEGSQTYQLRYLTCIVVEDELAEIERISIKWPSNPFV